jgi:hypothetical protein
MPRSRLIRILASLWRIWGLTLRSIGICLNIRRCVCGQDRLEDFQNDESQAGIGFFLVEIPKSRPGIQRALCRLRETPYSEA